MTFAALISKWREHMTLKQLAHVAQVSERTMRYWVAGKEPSLCTQIGVAQLIRTAIGKYVDERTEQASQGK